MQARNVIYIVPHDLGRNLGCYGRGIASPNIDAFAAGGMRLNQAHCNSPCCSPSRGCAMTGQYAHTNGLMGLTNQGWDLPAETKTVVDEFNKAGYVTAHFGHQHERQDFRNNGYQVEGFREAGDDYVENAVPAAIAWLESRAADDPPFYLNVGTVEVHASRWQTLDKFERNKLYKPYAPAQPHVQEFLPDFEPLRKELRMFEGAIGYFDAQLQPLFKAIERLGLAESTLVILSTDHGMSGERAKATLYSPGTEITMLASMPGTIGPGQSCDHLIQNIDVAPTVLDACGLDVPERMQGRSFWPLLCGDPYTPHEHIFLELNFHGGFHPTRAVRTPERFYLRNCQPELREWAPPEVTSFNETYETWLNELWPEHTETQPAEELYDLTTDPAEWVNLAEDPARQVEREQLAAAVDRWMHETNDPLLRGPIPDP